MFKHFSLYITVALLLALASVQLAGCAGRSIPAPEFVLHGPVDPAWFDDLAALEAREEWPALKDMAAFVLAHDSLDDKQRGWALYYSGRAFFEQGDSPLGLTCAREAALFLPGEIKPQALQGLLEFIGGNSMRGEHILYSLIAEYPQSVEVMLTLGRANQLSGHIAAARVWYERAAEIEPDQPRTLVPLALARWQEGDAEGALAEFDRIISLGFIGNKEAAAALNDQGVINLALGKVEEAARAFNQALKLDPESSEALHNRAVLLTAQGRFEAARRDIEAGLLAAPGDVGLLLARGQLAVEEGRYFEAYSAFEAAHVYERKNPHALNELAWFLATCPDSLLRNGERAVVLAEQGVLALEVADPGTYDTLAASYAAAGRFDDAKKAQITAIYLASKAGFDSGMISGWQARLQLYERGEAYYAR